MRFIGEEFRVNKRKESLTSLKDIISRIFQDTALPFNPEDGKIWRVWEEVVGLAVSRNAKPVWIQKGRLRVRVSDPIWLQELGLAADSIRQKLNKKLGREAVEKIEFRLGA